MIYIYCYAGTLGGIFTQILQGEDIIRERAIKFLKNKMVTLDDELWTKDVEDFVIAETRKVILSLKMSMPSLF